MQCRVHTMNSSETCDSGSVEKENLIHFGTTLNAISNLFPSTSSVDSPFLTFFFHFLLFHKNRSRLTGLDKKNVCCRCNVKEKQKKNSRNEKVTRNCKEETDDVAMFALAAHL